MLHALSAATSGQPSFSFTNLLILIVVIAVFYPLQRWIRKTVSERRRERWAEEDRLAQAELDRRDGATGSSDDARS